MRIARSNQVPIRLTRAMRERAEAVLLTTWAQPVIRAHGHSGLTEGDHVVAANEGDRAFGFNGLDCGVAGVLV